MLLQTQMIFFLEMGGFRNSGDDKGLWGKIPHPLLLLATLNAQFPAHVIRLALAASTPPLAP
jgi:hypothetical protein